jgi:serine/threonine-protein kinase
MSDLNWNEVEAIIDRAMDLPEGERKLFIKEQCGDNLKLKGEVTLLLESIFDSEGWLEDPADYKKEFYEEISDDVELLAAGQPLIGKQVGSYTIKEKIGEGGMGVVYRAERSDDEFAHRVAIKIIRHERATRENIRRFKHEQRILAGLNHPGIARLFDGGVTGDGFPYIIMEYVDGTPIDDYCHQQSCTLDHKIELFENVLEAVRYAHENLVIHRDLKPGNILVDQDGNIKILDFGISKLLEDEDDMELTQTGARLLTPRYAAPEQVRQENITTATDLYALGIVFYQLLSGEHPFDFAELSQYDVEQAILEQEAPRPSAKISSPKLQKKLQGDLDAIALKAIRKEPDKRYRVANEFLDDLKNYQTGLPVSAQEDSFNYRSQKFFKRHKQGVAIAAGILLLVIGLTGFYTWRIAQQRDMAQLEAEKSAQISNFLMSLFKASKPDQSKGETITARMLLDEGQRRAESLSEQPIVQARMLSLIGQVHMDLGNYTEADSLLQSALKKEEILGESDQKQKLDIMNNYADLMKRQGKYESADSILTKVLTLSKRYEIPMQTAITLNDLGNLAHLQSDFPKAESLHTKALNLRINLYGNEHKGVAASYNNIGLALHEQGQLTEAEKYYLRGLELDKQIHGELHSETTITMRNLGKLYLDLEQYKQADSFISKTVEINRKLLGDNHPRLAEDLNELAVMNARRGDYRAADSLFKEILSIQKATLAPDHPRIALTLNNLAWVVKKMDRIKVAEQYNREALAIARQRFGNEHFNTAIYTHNLANVLFNQEKYQEAKQLYRQSISSLRKVLPTNHVRISNPLYDLGRLLKKTGQPDQAEILLREALTIREDTLGTIHSQTALAQAALGNCLTDLKRYDEAKILLEKSYKTFLKNENDKSKAVKEMLTHLNEQIEQDW